MKVPAVAIAAAFAGGILLGLGHYGSSHAVDRRFLLLVITAVFFLLSLGYLFLWRRRVRLSTAVALAGWLGLGTRAACIAQQPLPSEHVLSRISNHQIPQKTPLPWHGILRDEPSRLPWGYGMEMNLRGVELADGYVPVSGGMRIGFTPKEGDPTLPDLHAGDEISVLTEARLPTVYKDPGAFDRREFLARQNVHVLATLRSSTLIEKTASTAPTIQTRIAGVRNKLRERLDALFPKSQQTAGILRAMLLGDRSFVDRVESGFSENGSVPCVGCGGSARGRVGVLSNVVSSETAPGANGTKFVCAGCDLRVCGGG